MKKSGRDIEKICTNEEFVKKLRALADALEKGGGVRLQVAGKRMYIPARAICSIEHEQEGETQEIEFQLKW